MNLNITRNSKLPLRISNAQFNDTTALYCNTSHTTLYRYITNRSFQTPKAKQIQARVSATTDSIASATLQYEQKLLSRLYEAEYNTSNKSTLGTQFHCICSNPNIIQLLQQQQYSQIKQHIYLNKLIESNHHILQQVCSVLADSRYHQILYNYGIKIRRVKLSVDMTHCTVYWCVYNAKSNSTYQYRSLQPNDIVQIEKLLLTTVKKIRTAITISQLKLRVIPIVQYSYDTHYDNAVMKQNELKQVNQTIQSIQDEIT